MACMEYSCECGFFTMNNRPSMSCPNCGKTCHGTFDEIPEPREYDGDEPEDYNEEE